MYRTLDIRVIIVILSLREGKNDLIDKAKISFANAHLHEELGQVRMDLFILSVAQKEC